MRMKGPSRVAHLATDVCFPCGMAFSFQAPDPAGPFSLAEHSANREKRMLEARDEEKGTKGQAWRRVQAKQTGVWCLREGARQVWRRGHACVVPPEGARLGDGGPFI